MAEIELNGSKILIVEDEENLAAALEYNLSLEGYQVECVNDGRSAVEVFSQRDFDLIILDIMLPHLNGFEVMEKIRSESPQIPIMVLTARSSPKDLQTGLELGADDYLTKPFHLQELLLRVRGMLKRKEWYKEDLDKIEEFSFGRNTINFSTLSASSDAKKFRLTLLEASLLKYLIKNKNRIVTREELLINVWNIDSDTETRTPENFIMRLRKYFEPKPAKPVYFKTIRSSGYIFSPDGE